MMAMLASVKEVLEKNDDFKLSELGKVSHLVRTIIHT